MTLACTVDRVGTPTRFFIVAILLGIVAFILGYDAAAIRFLIALLLTTGIVGLLKIIFRVERPKDAAFVIKSFSFPSGHTAGVTFLAIGILYLLSQVVSYPYLLGIGIALTPFVLLVAWSRIALRVHTRFQVFAGFVLGLLIPLWVFLANV